MAELADLLRDYSTAAPTLRSAYAGWTPDQLVARPVPGRWSALELLCHVVDADQVFADRIKRTIALDRPLLIGYDESLFVQRLAYHQRDLVTELAVFEATHLQVSGIVQASTPAIFERTCVHSERGLLTLADLFTYATRHVHHHLGFLDEKRRALRL